eukprot:g45944.t1
MWQLFKDLLIKVQDQHVPVRWEDKDGKEEDMEDSEICVEHANMLGNFEIKKEVGLGLLKSIKMDKSPSPGPDGIYPSRSSPLPPVADRALRPRYCWWVPRRRRYLGSP